MIRLLKALGLARRSTASLLMAAMICAAGCSTIGSGGAPKQSFNIDHDLEVLAKKFEQATQIEGFYDSTSLADPNVTLTPEQKQAAKQKRDKFITGRLVMVDLRYIQFIRGLTRDRALLDSSSDIAIMSLNLAGTAVGGAAAKTILSAVSAGISGGKVTLDRDFFYEKTVPALVASMNAQRAQARIPIIRGLQQDIDSYPFHTAVVDVQSYYEAGTFVGALAAIQADSGAKETTSKNEIKSIVDLGTDYYVNAKKLIAAIKALKKPDWEKAWKAFAPIVKEWEAVQKPPSQVAPASDLATFFQIFDQIYPQLDPKQRVTLYKNLVEQGLITP